MFMKRFPSPRARTKPRPVVPSLHELISQRTDSGDFDFDRVVLILYRPNAQRSAAADHVSGQQSHVVRDAADQLRGWENHVRNRVALALLPVQDRANPELFRANVGGDHRPEWAEAVEALGADPLWERWVFLKDVGSGDIVHARIAEDARLSFGL